MTIEKCRTCKYAFTTGKDMWYCEKALADKDDCGEYKYKIDICKFILHDFQLQTFAKWITFIPTIEVHIDNPMYKEKNIALILNVFIWHFRWLFIKENKEKT